MILPLFVALATPKTPECAATCLAGGPHTYNVASNDILVTIADNLGIF